MAQVIPTTALPFQTVDGIGFFTIFPNLDDAARVADGLTAQYAVDELTGTAFIVSQRADGKFLVTAIETADEECWHVPAALLRA